MGQSGVSDVVTTGGAEPPEVLKVWTRLVGLVSPPVRTVVVANIVHKGFRVLAADGELVTNS